MTFTIRIRGASSQPILQDFLCDDCGPFSATTERGATETPCPDCGKSAPWVISAPHGSVRLAEVERGKVAKPDSPYFCDTRELGEGMPIEEWRAKRAKYHQERRWKEFKRGE